MFFPRFPRPRRLSLSSTRRLFLRHLSSQGFSVRHLLLPSGVLETRLYLYHQQVFASSDDLDFSLLLVVFRFFRLLPPAFSASFLAVDSSSFSLMVRCLRVYGFSVIFRSKSKDYPFTLVFPYLRNVRIDSFERFLVFRSAIALAPSVPSLGCVPEHSWDALSLPRRFDFTVFPADVPSFVVAVP